MDQVLKLLVVVNVPDEQYIHIHIPFNDKEVNEIDVFAERCAIIYKNGIVDSTKKTWYPPSVIKHITYEFP